MIPIERFQLNNGLTVIHHKTTNSPIAAVNILYNVGSKDEREDKTGFAHLFEHLMFGGSKHIPDYDTPLQNVGGENNAFTSCDYTNFYITLPLNNIETAFWLESDRMNELAFTPKSLEVQRQVVIEEYKQNYLSPPYADVWLHLRPLVYKEHPYRWNTIGADIAHIENATMTDVKDFFYTHYAPNNAILSIAADMPTSEVERLANKWFGSISKRNVPTRVLPKEPQQREARSLKLDKPVPYDSIYKAYRMGGRFDNDFHSVDLLSDVLSNGDSSRMFQELMKKQQLFTNIDAYLMGENEPSTFIVSGHLREGVTFEQAEAAIQSELNKVIEAPVSDYELQKVKNKAEANIVYSNISQLNRAMQLAMFEMAGDANLYFTEGEKYQSVMKEEIMAVARKILRPENCSTLYYSAQK